MYVFIPHLYLIPIILLALWYPRSGLQLVFVILSSLGVFWIIAIIFGYPFPPLFILLYTGLDLAIFIVFLLFVKDQRLVEAVLSDLILRSYKKEESSSGIPPHGEEFDTIISGLTHPDEEIREEAVGALSGIQDERAVLPLIYALRDPIPVIRRAAADALGKSDSEKAVPPLIHTLTDDDRIVREEAAEALGHLGEISFPFLIEAGDDPDWRIRVGVIVALRVSSYHQGAPDLVTRGVSDENVYVRREAIKTLGRVGDHSAMPYLIQGLRDADPGVRIRTIRAVSRIGDQDEKIHLIRSMLIDPDGSVRMRAEEELRRLPERSSPKGRERDM